MPPSAAIPQDLPPSRTPVLEEPAESSRPTTAREVLAEYWGDEWARLEPVLAEQNDLDRPFRLLPWEEVAGTFESDLPLNEEEAKGQVRGIIAWPDPLTADWLRQNLSLPGVDLDEPGVLEEIDAVAHPYNDQLSTFGELWTVMMDQHVMQKWNSGAFVKAPFSTAGQKSETGFHASSHAAKGWVVTVCLTKEECPDMMALREEVNLVRDQREAAVLAAFRGRRSAR